MTQPFHDHFSEVAARYADFRPHYPPALFEYLATLAPRRALVWDCASGNGQAALDLAERFERVIATDASREQIATARPHPKIEYRVATAEESGLPGNSIGLITVAQALHWFDLERFYSEVRRVLDADGVLAAWAYGVMQVEGDSVDKVVQHYYSDVVGPYWPPERKLVEGGYRTIPFPFTEIAPPLFRMESHWTLEELLGYCSTWSATNRFVKANARNPLALLRSELERAWGRPDSTRLIAWPLTLRIGRRGP